MDRGICVVTGGGRGIGAATARRAAADGWTVCLSYRSDHAAAAALADEIGGRAVQAEVSNGESVEALFDTAADLGPITAVVANAGIVATTSALADMDAARLREMLEVNVLGALLTSRAAVRHMSSERGGGGGSMVLVSSAASRLGSPNQYVDYAASKGAVDTLTIGLAKEVADEGIRVNAVRPGIIDTEIHASAGNPDRPSEVGPQLPLGRAGTADEVAAAIVWLLGDDASYVTGSILDVAGGR
jgi:NAD(P)-dependent dehydrogenase (short-subunit alcohol dehydrogenase family)